MQNPSIIPGFPRPTRLLLAFAIAISTAISTSGRDDDDQHRDDRDRSRSRLAYPPDARVQGKTLKEWLSTYWRWYYGTDQDPARGKVGNVLLMPLPAGEALAGDISKPEDPLILRGQIEVTIQEGMSYVLPEFAWTGERYNNGLPDDLPIPDDILLYGAAPLVTIDGVRVITDCNKDEYYIPPTPFRPIVLYPTPRDYGAYAAIFFQGVGFVGRPLPVGDHRIRMLEQFIIPAGALPGFTGFGVIFDNTWILHVVAR